LPNTAGPLRHCSVQLTSSYGFHDRRDDGRQISQLGDLDGRLARLQFERHSTIAQAELNGTIRANVPPLTGTNRTLDTGAIATIPVDPDLLGADIGRASQDPLNHLLLLVQLFNQLRTPILLSQPVGGACSIDRLA
jgi:hypothetical protein